MLCYICKVSYTLVKKKQNPAMSLKQKNIRLIFFFFGADGLQTISGTQKKKKNKEEFISLLSKHVPNR